MATGSVAITAGTGTPIRTVTNAGVDAGAYQQIMSLADSAGNLLGTSAAPLPTQIISDPDTVATGTITANDAVVGVPSGNGALLTGTPTANSSVSIIASGGESSWNIKLSGTFGAGTIYFEASFDNGVTYVPVNGRQTGIVNTVLGFTATGAGVWRGNASGVTHLRVRLVGATAPNITVAIRISAGNGAFFLNASIPAGTNRIGDVSLADSITPANKATVRATMHLAGVPVPTTDSALVVANYPVASAFATVLGTANTANTLTLTAPGAGYRHYITSLRIQRYISVATTGAASGLVTTTANTTIVFQLPSDTRSIGQVDMVVDATFPTPIPAIAQNTATTFTTPAVAGTIYRISCTYYTAA